MSVGLIVGVIWACAAVLIMWALTGGLRDKDRGR